MSRIDTAELRRLHKDGAKSSQSFYVFDSIPALLDELEAASLEMRRQGSVIAELREEVPRLTQANGDIRKERDRAVKEAQRQDGVAKGLRAENERLQADNAKLAWAWDEVQSDTPKEAQDKARIIQAAVVCLNSLAWLKARDRRMKLIGAAEWLEANNERLDTMNRADVGQEAAKLRQEAEDGRND